MSQKRATLSRAVPTHLTPTLRNALALACTLLLVALPVTVRAQAGSAAPLGGDSPQDIIDKGRTAGEDEDLATMVGLVAPEDRAMLSLTLVRFLGIVPSSSQMAAGMAEGMDAEMSEDERVAMEAEREEAMVKVRQFEADFKEILKRYSVEAVVKESESDNPTEVIFELVTEDPTEVMADVEQVGLIVDLMKLMNELPGEEGGVDGGESVVETIEGELTDLEIQGDAATGIIGGEPVKFVRVDGRWYISYGLKEQLRQQVEQVKQQMGGPASPPS